MIRHTACLIARDVNPYRNLAIEKHLMETLPEDTAILYLWQNEHTIVLGRNQNPWDECRVEAFLHSGGRIARRLSGGGAVYHDLGNLNFTIIMPKPEFDIARQLNVVAMAVGSFGIQVEASGRNDLMVVGRKFCGNAYYKAGSAAYHHGTLMVNVNTRVMEQYLTVDERKLAGRGVSSVPARVVKLSILAPNITIETMRSAMYWSFANVYQAQPAMLDERMLDRATIDREAKHYEDAQWIYPEKLLCGFSVAERFAWGGVSVVFQMESGVIRAARVFTDAMEAVLFTSIEQALIGCPFLISAISARFEQRLELVTDPRLTQMANDLCTLICGKIRAMDRAGENGMS